MWWAGKRMVGGQWVVAGAGDGWAVGAQTSRCVGVYVGQCLPAAVVETKWVCEHPWTMILVAVQGLSCWCGPVLHTVHLLVFSSPHKNPAAPASQAERLKLRLTSAVQQMVRARNLPPLEGAPQQGGRSGCTEPPCMPGGSGEDEAAAAGVALTDAADAEAAPAPSRLQQAAAFFFPSQQQAQAGEEAEAGAAEGDGLGEAAAGAAGRAGARGSQAGQRAGGPAASASALRIMHLEQEVVAADAELAAAKAAHKAALEAAAAAQREAQAAEGRLQLCRAEGEGQEGEGGGGPQHLLPGLAGDVGE